jgi:AcrR family transcriptional regulator
MSPLAARAGAGPLRPWPEPALEPALEPAPGRLVGPKQAEIVSRLLEAAADEARESGYEGMTVRSAARRAGVAPATAYTYFASKDHLLAEVLWRRMQALPAVPANGRQAVAKRLAHALREQTMFMADDPALASAATTALLSSGPDVIAIRARLGAAMHARIVAALGEKASPKVVRALDLACFGGMLAAGLGHLSFEEVNRSLEDTVSLLLKEGR